MAFPIHLPQTGPLFPELRQLSQIHLVLQSLLRRKGIPSVSFALVFYHHVGIPNTSSGWLCNVSSYYSPHTNALTIRRHSLSLQALNLGWVCDLFWTTQWEEVTLCYIWASRGLVRLHSLPCGRLPPLCDPGMMTVWSRTGSSAWRVDYTEQK